MNPVLRFLLTFLRVHPKKAAARMWFAYIRARKRLPIHTLIQAERLRGFSDHARHTHTNPVHPLSAIAHRGRSARISQPSVDAIPVTHPKTNPQRF